MGHWIHWLMSDLGARWVLTKIVVAFPVLRRSDGSGNKVTTAIWTNVAQDSVNTRNAKGALIGTDACVKRIRWQCFVAVLTIRSQFKHGVSFL